MKTACLTLFALLASCTVPTTADDEGAGPAGSRAATAADPATDTIYVEGLIDPVEDDGRSLYERDLERIGRRP